MRSHVFPFWMLLLISSCQKQNPLIDKQYLLCTYKYSIIQYWTGDYETTEIIDTLYLSSADYSMILRSEDTADFLICYENSDVRFSKTFTMKKFYFGACDMFFGNCFGRTILYDNELIDGEYMVWTPPDQEFSQLLYSQFPLNRNLLDLPENYRVWNVFDKTNYN